VPRPYPVPPQYFRPESFTTTSLAGSVVAVGTLWVVLEVGGVRRVIREKNHPLPLHHVNEGLSTGRHDLHARKLERWQLADELGRGSRLYRDVLRQMRQDMGQPKVRDRRA